MILEKAFSFIKRDFIQEVSYRFAFFLQIFGIFFSILTFYYLAQMLGTAAVPYLEPYGGDYFSFVLIGIAFSNYLMTGLSSFAGSIRNEQMMGTLEAMLVTPTKTSSIITFSSLWSFIFASFRVLIYLLMGVLVFNVEMNDANFIGAIVVIFLTILCFSSLGIISASFIMVFKRGDPINWVFNMASGLLGGVLYPIAVLPEWLQNLSYLLPITYSLRAMRLALLQGMPMEAFATDIIALMIFSAVMLPIGMVIFRYAVKRAKQDGTLTQY